MDFGIVCFPTDTSIEPQDLGPALESRGFESLFYAEHTHIPTSRRSPFIGGGVMFRNENGLKIAPHVTGGVDVPLSRNITGTVQLNVGLPSDRKADMGLLLGVGYSF